MEISNMKANEPSRTALTIARQRAAHQVLDHGSILYGCYRQRSELHCVNPELGGGVRLHGTPQAFSEELRQLEKARTEQLEKIGERSVSRFEPAGIAAILRSHGFCDIEDINFQEIPSRFARSVQGLAPGQAGLHVVHAKH